MTPDEELLLAQKIEPVVLSRVSRLKKPSIAMISSIVKDELERQDVYDPADRARISNIVRRMCKRDGILTSIRIRIPSGIDFKSAAANDTD